MANSDFQEHFTLSKIALNFLKIIGLKPNYFKEEKFSFWKDGPNFCRYSSISKKFKFLFKPGHFFKAKLF